ncbi:hypothetical protein [Nocardioides antri]|uniref:Uncharacterized protein n=1 Tax=Nocardioides antri TaxID=2607659 RepID=A0A5B1M3N3_9ACTN|nr:hypothetical protein [Nocardioides antri]KAA1427246.1 hypothetical protein F0U47_07035 [Nocardioides antri]
MSRRARLMAAVLGVALLGGCGSASAPSPPTGVDELVIPSPSLDAADFVDEIDNPWLPLAPGNEWVYQGSEAGARSVVTVLDDHREIQGVTATVVRTTVTDVQGREVEDRTTWFAQDEDGNVWSLGEDGVWEAGVGGAEAGLAMPARPRIGDGYRTEYLAGVAEDSAQVVSLDGSASVPYGDLTDLLETEVTSPLAPGVVERRLFARDIGLVRVVTDDEGDELALVAFEG